MYLFIYLKRCFFVIDFLLNLPILHQVFRDKIEEIEVFHRCLFLGVLR